MMQNEFEINSTTENGKTTLKMSGFADFMRVGVIDNEINAIVRDKPDELVIDLEGLKLMASLAIGALVTCASSVRKRGGKVTTINPGSDVAETLKMVKLEEILGLQE